MTFLSHDFMCCMKNKTLGGEKMTLSFKKECVITMFSLIDKDAG